MLVHFLPLMYPTFHAMYGSEHHPSLASTSHPGVAQCLFAQHLTLQQVILLRHGPGGQFTGAALNPARVLGPAIVFHCYWNSAFVYVFGELFGGLLAAVIVLPLYGFGQFGSLLDTRVCSSLGIKIPDKHQHRCALLLLSPAVVLAGSAVLDTIVTSCGGLLRSCRACVCDRLPLLSMHGCFAAA